MKEYINNGKGQVILALRQISQPDKKRIEGCVGRGWDGKNKTMMGKSGMTLHTGLLKSFN